jgi:hypothetical protein
MAVLPLDSRTVLVEKKLGTAPNVGFSLTTFKSVFWDLQSNSQAPAKLSKAVSLYTTSV